MNTPLSSRTPLEPIVLTIKPSDKRFFIPRIKPANQETVYQQMAAHIVDQFKWKVLPTRIESLVYRRDRKKYNAKVGRMEPQEACYEVVALFESSLYIVVTQTAKGEPGPSILINPDEVMVVSLFKTTSTS